MITEEGFFECGTWYMSRQNDPNDWGYGEVDAQGGDGRERKELQKPKEISDNMAFRAGTGI